jgi:hypothetical protein
MNGSRVILSTVQYIQYRSPVTGYDQPETWFISLNWSKPAENRVFERKPCKNEFKTWFTKVWTNVVTRVCKDLKPEINRT